MERFKPVNYDEAMPWKSITDGKNWYDKEYWCLSNIGPRNQDWNPIHSVCGKKYAGIFQMRMIV
jgi:hypothetical protein